MTKITLKHFFVLVILTAMVLLGYSGYSILKVGEPFPIDKQLARVMKVATTMMNATKAQPSTDGANAIALDSNGTSMVIKSQFQSLIKTSSGLTGNNLTVSLSDSITVSTQIQVDPRHVGKTAHVVVMASYQSPDDGMPAVFFQRRGDDWEPLALDHFKAAQSVPQLPETLDVSIYEGNSLGVASNISIFVGYVLENKSLILSIEPIRLVFVEG